MADRIALLYDHILDFGGVESHLHSLIRQIDPKKYQFVLIAPFTSRFEEKLASYGVRVIQNVRWQAFRPSTYLQIVRILQEESISLIHCHSPHSAIPGRLAARWLKLPAVVTVHAPVMRYHGTRQNLKARLGRWMYTELDRLLNHTLTDRLIYVSSQVREECVASGLSPAEKSIVILNGINLSQFPGRTGRDASRHHFQLAEKDTIITYAGRLDEQKKLDMLLEAFYPLCIETKNVRLWLVGDGLEREKLEQQAKTLDITDLVHFWGYQAEIYPYLAASDIFVLPSSNEAMPASLLEALACGLPCVATTVGENKRIIEHGKQGLLIPPLDSTALTEALHQLVDSTQLRQKMSGAAQERASGFSDEHMATQVSEVYSELLSHKK